MERERREQGHRQRKLQEWRRLALILCLVSFMIYGYWLSLVGAFLSVSSEPISFAFLIMTIVGFSLGFTEVIASLLDLSFQ
jgi:hypothetical protein